MKENLVNLDRLTPAFKKLLWQHYRVTEKTLRELAALLAKKEADELRDLWPKDQIALETVCGVARLLGVTKPRRSA